MPPSTMLQTTKYDWFPLWTAALTANELLLTAISMYDNTLWQRAHADPSVHGFQNLQQPPEG